MSNAIVSTPIGDKLTGPFSIENQDSSKCGYEAAVPHNAERLLLKPAQQEPTPTGTIYGAPASDIEQDNVQDGEKERAIAEKGEASDKAGEEQEQEQEQKEDAADEEEKEESMEDIFEALQEDEELRSYMPDYIKRMLDHPPVPPGMTARFFRAIFDSVAESMWPHRPKSDLEFLALFNAAKAIVRLVWLDDLNNRVVHNNRREAVESLHHKLNALVPTSKKEKDEHECAAKEEAMDYFADSDRRDKFSEQLVRGGFGADAVDTEAFQRSLPSLGKIEVMRKAAIRERDQALKTLERAYSSRDPEQRMPLSIAACRNLHNQMREEKKLVLEEAKKADQNGDA